MEGGTLDWAGAFVSHKEAHGRRCPLAGSHTEPEPCTRPPSLALEGQCLAKVVQHLPSPSTHWVGEEVAAQIQPWQQCIPAQKPASCQQRIKGMGGSPG